MSRREQKSQTRSLILQAALRLYARTGIGATRSSEVADEAGCAHGTVFLHFRSQEELLAAVIEDFGMRIAARLHELATRGAGLRSVLEAHLQGLAENEDFYARLVSESPTLPRQARITLTMIQSTISQHFEEALAAMSTAGPRPALHLMFNTWIGLIHHYVVNRDSFAPGQSVLLQKGPELLDFYVGLIGHAAGRGES
ncbi:MAG TPA: TetR/AcrR family transcriptional regulator [Rectinemataceae bacterium]|nr:TetR/AcrR family transcriptional regulator [Rectinemataceae bacterium]